MAIKLKSEKRIKQVVTSGGGAENANTYESGDLVYSTSDDTLKQSDATNWKDVPVHPITKLYITANGSSHYVFNGPGFDATANSNTGDRNPTIYLVRGQKYQFENLLGAHPFRISSSDGGGAYADGITNNGVSNGILEWNVMHDVPNTMYYYCTSHAAMKGEIKIVDAGSGGATNLSATANGTSLTVESSTGNNVALPVADASNWGVMSDELFVKLNGIEASADVTDAANVNAAGAIMHTDLGTKGQIVVGDGTGDATILGVGTNNYVLTADSGEASGIKWAAAPSAANFAALSDTPANFTSAANKFLKVNAGANAVEFVTMSSVPTIGGGDGSKFVKVNSGSNALEYVTATIPTTVGALSDVAAIGGGDANKFVKVNSSGNALEYVAVSIPAAPMFAAKTVSGSNVAIHGDLNSGDGGTLTVADSAQNAGGTTAGHGVMVNVASLTKTGEKARYEIHTSTASKGFRFKADTTVIDSFGGQAQIAAGTGNSDGVSVGDAQKLVLLYTGSAWKYMIQSI